MGNRYSNDRFPERRCLRLSEWPDTDAKLWQASLASGNLIDGVGSRARYRSISNKKVERGYGRWLTFMARTGSLNISPPAARITQAAVIAYVEDMRELQNASYTILARLQELYEAALVMDPGGDWRWIRRVASRVRATSAPSRDKRSRLVTSADLLNLGLDLMRKADQSPTERLGGIMFRDGAILAFASLRPLRLKNLASIELHRHLVKHGSKWWLTFEPDELKNGDPLEMPWPEILIDSLQTWLRRWRPILCRLRSRWARDIGTALWVSSHGSPMTMQAIYDRIVVQTRLAFGFSVNPHLIRDIAASTLADVDPEHVRITAPLLGHRNFGTTERYYIHANMMKATRRYQQELLRLRRGPKQ